MKPTIFDLPDATPNRDNIAQPGDVLLVLSRDGSSRIVTVGMDRETIITKVQSQQELTDDEQADLDTAHRAFCLSIAAASEQVMAILEDLANDTDVIDPAKLARLRLVN